MQHLIAMTIVVIAAIYLVKYVWKMVKQLFLPNAGGGCPGCDGCKVATDKTAIAKSKNVIRLSDIRIINK